MFTRDGRFYARDERLATTWLCYTWTILDLTEAFYRILRPLVVGGALNDELIMHVGSRLGLSSDPLAELYNHLEEPSALSRAHMPSHMQNAIGALMRIRTSTSEDRKICAEQH